MEAKPWPASLLGRAACHRILAAERPDILVTGTSFENSTESWFRRLARIRGVHSFAALDHWCNYRHRFELPNGGLAFPDRLGVMDKFAFLKMKEAGICRRDIAIVGHPVLESLLRIRKPRGSKSRQVLFLSEPISWDGKLDPKVVRYPGHNELTILRRLLEAFAERPELRAGTLLIRPHPLEPVTRLRAVVRKHAQAGLKVRIDRSRDLEAEFASSRAVLGITSIALLQAQLMGAPVLSLQPKHARGRIPDDIAGFLPRIRSSDCFIEAVSKFCLTRRAAGSWFIKGRRPKLPRDSKSRIASEIEKLVGER